MLSLPTTMATRAGRCGAAQAETVDYVYLFSHADFSRRRGLVCLLFVGVGEKNKLSQKKAMAMRGKVDVCQFDQLES